MISEATGRRLQELFASQNDYRPKLEITAELQQKVILMFIGATCEGKNTVMEAVAQLDDRFRIAGTFTSRPPREGDDAARYTYYENSDAGLQPLFERIDRHEVVQYAVNPHAQLIYGSEPKDYPATYNLGDVFSSAVTSFRQLGFRQATALTIITDPKTWLGRFEARFPAGHPQRQARRDEAIESFNWSLAQSGPDHFWVENIDGQPEAAAREVIAISLGSSGGDPAARQLAEASLVAARKIIS